jgi:hypothetical protein
MSHTKNKLKNLPITMNAKITTMNYDTDTTINNNKI